MIKDRTIYILLTVFSVIVVVTVIIAIVIDNQQRGITINMNIPHGGLFLIIAGIAALIIGVLIFIVGIKASIALLSEWLSLNLIFILCIPMIFVLGFGFAILLLAPISLGFSPDLIEYILSSKGGLVLYILCFIILLLGYIIFHVLLGNEYLILNTSIFIITNISICVDICYIVNFFSINIKLSIIIILTIIFKIISSYIGLTTSLIIN